ncbi:alpha/beta fold hydrolase [Kushneria aurantia]|uniref:Alpha/beta fold hydrolase n=1 Tax=Kushneria aurantia TaxID=504092 RepID=A0ABV6G1W5_9GAMM|nr:alpha/beta hydrolase [Kushneria aurantia]
MSNAEHQSEQILHWEWGGRSVEVGVTRRGEGPQVLLLPALSTISTRHEMDGLQEKLAARFATISVDWPGYGDRPRPFLEPNPKMLADFVGWLLDEVVFLPEMIVAAGHGAGTVLRHLQAHPEAADRLVLIAPTWRGPLPTMTGERKPWFGHLRSWFDRPVAGAVLYRLNVSRWFIRRMAGEHVYETPNWLSGERLAAKQRVARTPGARHGSIRFVTGEVDPFETREAFVAALEKSSARALVVITESMPPRSRAEMKALSPLADVDTASLPHGRLSVHEEHPDDVAHAIFDWLDR